MSARLRAAQARFQGIVAPLDHVLDISSALELARRTAEKIGYKLALAQHRCGNTLHAALPIIREPAMAAGKGSTMQHHAHAPRAAAPIDEPLDFGTADLLALPVLLVLCLLFFLVGVWDTLRENFRGDGQHAS